MIPANFSRNGVIIFRGPSRIDGAPIIVVATGLRSGSVNAKTGRMIQTWILRADVDPLAALRTGLDKSICGACIFRPAWHNGETYGGRECYVNVAQAPLNVWRTADRGRYWQAPPEALPALFRGRIVRLGSYGDPAAVPLAIWDGVLTEAAGHTGYTHQARSAKLRDVLKYCQVSADCAEDAREARAAGVGSFRVLADGEAPLPFEYLCPAVGPAAVRCEDCQLCSGYDGQYIAIPSHGIGAGQSPHRGKRRPLQLPVLNPVRSVVGIW